MKIEMTQCFLNLHHKRQNLFVKRVLYRLNIQNKFKQISPKQRENREDGGLGSPVHLWYSFLFLGHFFKTGFRKETGNQVSLFERNRKLGVKCLAQNVTCCEQSLSINKMMQGSLQYKKVVSFYYHYSWTATLAMHFRQNIFIMALPQGSVWTTYIKSSGYHGTSYPSQYLGKGFVKEK